MTTIKGETDKNEILARRARQLAAAPETAQSSENRINTIVFWLGLEMYAIESRYINEIYPFGEITEIPGVPPFVSGLINVRRNIVCVIDLKNYFNINCNSEGAARKVIVLEWDDSLIGIVVDEVLGVMEIDTSNMQSQLPAFLGDRNSFTIGIVEQSIVLFDGKKILTSSELAIGQQYTDV